jgi:hypothetical protein
MTRTPTLDIARAPNRALRRALALTLLASIGCGAEGDEGAAIESYDQALNACEETVPTNRYIDGLPAYAQCTSFQNGAIYSNNGIDTSATKVANDWVQTQPSGGYQCTELVHRYWMFKWNNKWLPRGNAGTWCDTVPPASSGVVQTTTPVHGDAIVLAPGSCGASASTGHTALVDVVDSAGMKVTVVEQNQARRGNYAWSCGKCFLHLVANDGSDAGTANKPAPLVDAGGASPPIDAGSLPPRSDAGGAPVDAAQGVIDASTLPAPAIDAGVPLATPEAGSADAGLATPAGSEAGTPAQPAADSEADEGCSAGRTRGPQGSLWNLLWLAGVVLWRRRPERVARP